MGAAFAMVVVALPVGEVTAVRDLLTLVPVDFRNELGFRNRGATWAAMNIGQASRLSHRS